ncbi:MAG: class C sortase [Lachnospiraceae bacterium]|nr:class C sortase [Lachnospiraceae bacterium]
MKNRLQILFGVFLILAGGLCFLYPDFREWRTQRSVERTIENFQRGHAAAETDNKTAGGIDRFEAGRYEAAEDMDWPAKREYEVPEGTETGGKAVFSELYAEMQEYNERLATEGQHIVDAWSYEQAGIDFSVLSEEKHALGYIEIPDMEVRLPLFAGASEENLASGAAILAGTSMPVGGENTNCVIAAHRGWRGSAYFQYIENMKEGSLVYITNPWETLVYRADDIRIISPDDVDAVLIQDGRDMVTLFTCHPYMSGGLYRYLVFCERADPEEGSEAVSTRHQEWKKEKKKEIRASGSDETEGMGEETESIPSSAGLVLWEKYIRIVLPPLLLLFASILIFFRHIK